MQVKIKDLTKSFQNNLVLNHINLEIAENEIAVLMGESGCGKTTFMRCLCHLEMPDSGFIQLGEHVLFDGEITKDNYILKNIYKEIGMVFQNYQLFNHRTVLQNIIDAPIYHHMMTKEEAKEKAMQLLKQLNIEGKANSYPYELSGGQKQRVAIARACILKPKILCLDEPTSALDPQSIEQLSLIIKALQKKMTIIIITHDLAFGKRIATKEIMMKEINQMT